MRVQAAEIADQAFPALVTALGRVPVVVVDRQSVPLQVVQRVLLAPIEDGMHLIETVLELDRLRGLTLWGLVAHDAAQPARRL